MYTSLPPSLSLSLLFLLSFLKIAGSHEDEEDEEEGEVSLSIHAIHTSK